MRLTHLFMASAIVLAAGSAAADSGSSMAWPHAADSNNDGLISRDEIMSISEVSFNKHDLDDDGTISRDEWDTLLNERYQAARAESVVELKSPAEMQTYFHERFVEQDLNADGTISKAEWTQLVEAHFAKLDQNGDGMIAEDEYALYYGGTQSTN